MRKNLLQFFTLLFFIPSLAFSSELITDRLIFKSDDLIDVLSETSKSLLLTEADVRKFAESQGGSEEITDAEIKKLVIGNQHAKRDLEVIIKNVQIYKKKVEATSYRLIYPFFTTRSQMLEKVRDGIESVLLNTLGTDTKFPSYFSEILQQKLAGELSDLISEHNEVYVRCLNSPASKVEQMKLIIEYEDTTKDASSNAAVVDSAAAGIN